MSKCIYKVLSRTVMVPQSKVLWGTILVYEFTHLYTKKVAASLHDTVSPTGTNTGFSVVESWSLDLNCQPFNFLIICLQLTLPTEPQL